MRYLVLDFETNGLPNEKWLQPCPAFPTQVSVDAFVPATGEVLHLYDTFIRGALDLTPWVLQHTPVTHELLDRGLHPEDVASALEGLWQEGDILVAHNAQFDLGQVLPKMVCPTHPFLAAPFICTKLEAWVRKEAGKTPKLSTLCNLLGVPFHEDQAHDATYDTRVLALCLKAAHEAGRTWSLKVPSSAGVDRRIRVTRGPILWPLPEDRVLQFGKHQGSTFGEVLANEPDYCMYLMGLPTPGGQAAQFLEWVRTQRCDRCERLRCRCGRLAPMPAPPHTVIQGARAIRQLDTPLG